MERIHYDLQSLKETAQETGAPGKLFCLLVIDEDSASFGPALRELFPDALVSCFSGQSHAFRFFVENQVDVVLLGHSRDYSCLELLHQLKSFRPSVPVLVTTAEGSEDFAVQVFRGGARDYLKKPLEPDELELCIRAVLRLKAPDPFRTPDGVQRAISYIHENYGHSIRLSQVAREAGMSPSCFTRTFKARTGTTFSEYVNTFRINQAKKMLKNNLPMAKVMESCGFTNQIHFIRTFKKLVSCTPRDFRSGMMKNAIL